MRHIQKDIDRSILTTIMYRLFQSDIKPGFNIIATVGDASPRQAQGHIGDSCVKFKHFLRDVSDVADQTGTVRGRIERAEMSLKPGFHMIVTSDGFHMSLTAGGHVANVSQ